MPFLTAGYGVEEDSWGIALAAFHTKFSGIYEPSRFPGHPVQELIYSALWGRGPLIFNGLSAFFSAVGVLFFVLILKHLQFRHFFIAGLAFAFIPVYFISSTYTIDFVWTETFVLISLFLLLKRKLILCGLFLGLAVGCRITSGAMLLPFLIMIWEQKNWRLNFVHLLKMFIPMAVVVVIAFIPLFRQFGFSFFMYYDQFPYPPLTKVLYKMSIGVFGLIGLVAVAGAFLMSIVNQKKLKGGNLFVKKLDKKMLIACVVMLMLFTISYFRLPQKSGYMIPLLPFVILLLGNYLTNRQFVFFCCAIIVSPFVLSINLTDKLRGAAYSSSAVKFKISGQELFIDPFTGPVFSDYSKRIQKMNYVNQVIESSKKISRKTIIISGWWYNEIMVEMITKEQNNNVNFEPYIDSVKINNYITGGYEIYYLPEQNTYNDLLYKMNCTNTYSKEFNF